MKKNIFKALAVLAAVFAFAGCQKEAPEDNVNISSAKIVASAAGETQTISFTSNVAWTMASSADWVSVSPASGEAGSANVSVTISPNTTYSQRSTTLTLNAGKKSTSWTVEQGFVEVFGAASEINVTAAAQAIEVAVTANQAFEAKTDVDWISVISTKAAPDTKTVTLGIKANTGIETRSGNIIITAADGSVNSFKVNQAPSENAMSLKSVTYLGTAMMPYDDINYCPSAFEEYALAFETVKGQVILAVNVEGESLTGEYLVDAGASHVPGTFSLKPIEGYNKYYTTIIEDGTEIPVTDGIINITEADGNLEVAATLMDEHENIREYTFSGKKADVVNDNIAASGSASYYGDYETHFASKQKKYGIYIHPSAAIKDGIPAFYSIGFDIYADASYDGKEIPTGKYTIVSEEAAQTIDSKYINGIKFYPENSSAASYAYSDYDFETWESKSYNETEGTVEITKGSVEGMYNFDVDIKVQEFYYDEDWNVVYGDIIPFAYKFENVYVPIEDNHQEPVEDVDQVFTYAFPQQAYSGFWYGDAYETGGNVFLAGWSSGVNGVFSVQMVLQSSQPYTFELNFSGRYCNTPVPAGTYTWSADTPKDAEGKALDIIANCKSTTYKTITNSYTGTVGYISAGSVTFTDDTVEFDLTTTTADGLELHYTGGFPSTCYYFRDYSANATQKAKIAWAE